MIEETPPYEQATSAPDSSKQTPGKTGMLLAAVFLVTTLICAVGWYSAATPRVDTEGYKNYAGSWGMDGTVFTQRWKVNGNRSSVLLDLNYDLNFEKYSIYNISDQLISEEFDENEDGVAERTLRYSPECKVRYEYLDADGNGWYERMLSYGRTITIEYKDSDFDCEYDSIYVYENELLINSLTVAEMGKFFKTQRSDSTRSNR